MSETNALPFWMKMMFSPWILWFIIVPYLGSLLAWKIIFDNSSEGDKVLKEDKRRSIFNTWLTIFLCNLLSCVLLFAVEFVMRMISTSGIRLNSLTIWDTPMTVTVYVIPVIISFFVISGQLRHRAHYMVSDRIPARIMSWVMAVFFSPWFILIPSSAVWNLTDLIG